MNELGTNKVRGVFRRRTIPILLTSIATLGVAAAFIAQLQPGYKASAVIRAAEVQPAREYVAPTVAEQIGERLKSLRLAVMARPLVEQAAGALGLVRESQELDKVVDDIKSRMDVKVEGSDTFELTYTDPSPERAKAIVNKVAELFMQRHVAARQQIAAATVTSFKRELAALEPELAKAEASVRDYKLQHYGALPEQLEGNLRTLDQTTMELNIQSTNLDTDQERRRQLLAASLSPLRHHEETLSAGVHEARTKYSADHPEVRRIAAEYDRVHAQRLEDERGLNEKVRQSNPELVALEGQIARQRAIVSALRGRQEDVRKRVEGTARNGQALAGLQVAYEGIRDKYHATLTHVRDAETAAVLERGLAALRFDLVEGASLPQRSISPHRALLGVGALLLALALGLGVGFLLDAHDTTIRDPEQLRDLTISTPVLAIIPNIDLPKGTLIQAHGPKAEA